MGTYGQPGYVFRDFVLNRVSHLLIFVSIRASVYQFLSSTRYLYLDDKQQNFYKLFLINIDLVSG